MSDPDRIPIIIDKSKLREIVSTAVNEALEDDWNSDSIDFAAGIVVEMIRKADPEVCDEKLHRLLLLVGSSFMYEIASFAGDLVQKERNAKVSEKLSKFTPEEVQDAVKKCDGNKSAAARELKIHVSTVRRILEK